MDVSIIKRARGGKEQIDIQEAYNIWNWLRIRYNSLETFQFYVNFIHDRDFSLLMDRFLEDTKKHMKVMEEEGQKFKIPVPDKPPRDIKFEANINQVTDKFIYNKIFADMVAELYTISRTVRSTTTNDRLRKVFTQDMLAHLRNFEFLFKYGKFKGWENIPPTYKMASPLGQEDVSLTEAFHLFDHLSERYDHLRINNFFTSIAHDQEFKTILKLGAGALSSHIKLLETELTKYGVPLPERPPSSIEITIDPESLKDRFLYRTIFTGIVEAIDLHMRAAIESIKNDSLRSLFLNILKEEVNMFDKFLKYGKTKGWTKVVPIYGEPVP